MIRFNPRISVYWLWLVFAFVAAGVVSWHLYPDKLTGNMQDLPLVIAYFRPELFNDWQPKLIDHALATTLLATLTAVAHSLYLGVQGRSEPATFSLRSLLLGTAMVAVVLGGLRWCAAPPGVSCAVVIMLSGYPATVIVGGLLCRRMTQVRAFTAAIISPVIISTSGQSDKLKLQNSC
jgi:hypothetical protein